MKKLRNLLLPIALVLSFSAGAFTVFNDTTETVHFRVYGPSISNYYGKVRAGDSVSRNANKHVKLYVYFRRAYDFFFPFTPGGTFYHPSRDIICPELVQNGVHQHAQIHVIQNGAFYQCRVSMPNSTS